MEVFRKYFSEKQLQELEDTGPNWGVNVHTVGHHQHLPGTSYPDPQHPSSYVFDWSKGRRLAEYQIVFVANGEGVYEGEKTGLTKVQAGTIMLLFPGVWHRYKPLRETGWEEFWVGFDGLFADYLMRQECFDPEQPLIGIGFNAEFLDIFRRLIDVLKYEGVAFRQISSCLVIQMLGLVYSSALMKNQTQLRQKQIVQSVLFKIHENWEQALDFKAIAKEQNVSYEWLRKAFKAEKDISPGQYLLNLKIEKSGQMLRETTLTVAEIATKSGFESEFYFSRIFKKKMGQAPSSYRGK
ncbi:MAG TPA: AraC family transcriptional regulator [Saprospiraceae bacterium]|nr:AraC family transcriptional regulator [Saprospiraceae bacterium]HMQ83327.1 AraC family transcriptional regulator [Saprospiraceae bacterium]